ncbi:hypothetical protein A2531_02790 [Candidatus Falkowbacteria bacterium RIFOXYD2_FULL_34_120]|uniref:Polymerase nucleotidyl transferase domain-containing protein n=1 Tax=Candidatus Falkowbacteria bacterium RIFOXYD2_FULL_34_120 TaxID=1798007 RepID=A0A1F5TRM5_9BACT|nr:MAG: hypothetical protein A2466_03075 [Candidatus Falkowbacteria bacterium RIFOXYC2_FULL_34_220]OGF39428.1 MAG: hypothetical protein A2515_03815 [Candidatus Falkowbacteria bacterium RIFOXYD12_FULL_34_57]OGF41590.1 MAG: hypothetical protein A2531_02790 [Candidatus Falkowbacteria bacterium RIFOXYD2_FULL_34_120]
MTEKDAHKEIGFSPPIVELLLDIDNIHKLWPQEIANNKDFQKQLIKRKRLSNLLDIVISSLPRPDISLQEAVSKNYLQENQIAGLYGELSDLLEDSRDYHRIILYLPFEFLPDVSWKPFSCDLQEEMQRFKATYMNTWYHLLNVHDVRANFVDGDVLEKESRGGDDFPRVVKAAHLIPQLVEKGFLSIKEIYDLLEDTEDMVLQENIKESLFILDDLGFISGQDSSFVSPSNKQAKKIDLFVLGKNIEDEFRRINSEVYHGITKNREAWLKQDKKRLAIEKFGDKISRAIIDNKLRSDALLLFMTTNINKLLILSCVNGIRKAIEFIVHKNEEQGRKLYKKYEKKLISFWEIGGSDIRETLSQTFYRLHGLRVIDKERLNALGINIPYLAGPFSKNLDLMPKEMSDIRDMTDRMLSDKNILKYLYPVILILGSRLKGYGSDKSDIDFAIFLRPGVHFKKAKKLRISLKKIFVHEKIHGDIVEFWLKNDGHELVVSKVPKKEVFIGEKYWSDSLFGGAWIGDINAIKKIRERLLIPYFYDRKETIYGRDARGLYIEELERDNLQYRLMHKGYARFCPVFGGVNTANTDKVDGLSMFWDSGYRQIATKLFIGRVFLPKIKL